MNLELVAALASVITAIASIGGFIAAFFQLKGIRENIKLGVEEQKLNGLRVVLEIETQMNERKVHFDKVARELREAEQRGADQASIEILADHFETAKENYFNALDRLCFCILKKYLDERDWRSEYRNVLNNTIQTYENDFLEASPYRNTKELNRLWQSQ